MKTTIQNRKKRGYSLIEVLVASTIMMVGVSAACVMSLAMVSHEEGNYRAARALNYFENAMQLVQLGLTASEIADIMPPEPSLVSITFTPNTSAIANVGTPERVDVTMEFSTAIHLVKTDAAGNVTPAWRDTSLGTGESIGSVTWSPGKWTGGADGSNNIRVTQTIPVLRTSVSTTGS